MINWTYVLSKEMVSVNCMYFSFPAETLAETEKISCQKGYCIKQQTWQTRFQGNSGFKWNVLDCFTLTLFVYIALMQKRTNNSSLFFLGNALLDLGVSVSKLSIILIFFIWRCYKVGGFWYIFGNSVSFILETFSEQTFGLVYLENFAEKNRKSSKRSIKEVGRKSKSLNDLLVGLECFSILFSNPWWAKTL